MSAKKGMELALVTLIVIILVALMSFFLLKIAVDFSDKQKDIYDRETCKTSVSARIFQLKTTNAGIKEPSINFKCSTQQLELNEKNYKRNEKKQEYTKDTSFGAKKAIADEMSDCWYQFLEGQGDPFGKIDGDKTRCFICSEVKFESISKGEIGNLKEFLEKTPESTGAERTYSQYLYKGENAYFSPEEIDTSKHYSVVWFSFDLANKDNILKKIDENAPNSFTAFVLKAEVEFLSRMASFFLSPLNPQIGGVEQKIGEELTDYRIAYVTFIPSEEVYKVCEQIL